LASSATEWIAKVVDDLKTAGDRALVIVGREQPPAVHAIAHTINEQLHAIGRTIRFVQSPQVRPKDSPSDVAMLHELAAEMQDGKVSSLFVLGGNPVFDAPRELEFGRAIANVEFTLTVASAANETTEACQWLVPRSHFLESWSDARTFDGTASIVQPLIGSLHESLSEIELLAILCEDAPTDYAAVRKTWSATLGERDDDFRWKQAVANGVIAGTKS
jgi:molybdopterin-containing oxidoreductase family iron-sulfur binding subunit